MVDPFASFWRIKFANWPSWSISQCLDSGTVVVQYDQKEEVPSSHFSTNLQCNSIFAWVNSKLSLCQVFHNGCKCFFEPNLLYSQNACLRKRPFTMEVETLLPRKQPIVNLNVFNWLLAMVRRSGATTREPRDAISKWQTVEQGLMVFFGQEILIAPAAIQADVEVSPMFSCYHQWCFLF